MIPIMAGIARIFVPVLLLGSSGQASHVPDRSRGLIGHAAFPDFSEYRWKRLRIRWNDAIERVAAQKIGNRARIGAKDDCFQRKSAFGMPLCRSDDGL
jgi:hypothetical protein